MKQLLFLIVGVLSVLPTFAAEADFVYTYKGQTLRYTILGGNTCKITDGELLEPSVSIRGDLEIPEVAIFNGKEYTVTEIGKCSLTYTQLTSVTIPNSVTKIGYWAFEGCDLLKSVTIGSSVSQIELRAFAKCPSLTSVSFLGSVTSITSGAFEGCTGLNKVEFASIESLLQTNSGGSLHNPHNLWIAGEEIKDLVIPSTIDSIKPDTFWGCIGLTSLTIPNSVTSIGENAFADCSGLTSLTIPNSVTSIGNDAFWGCSGLTSLTIPNSVTSIGDGAFRSCTRLTSMTIPNSITSIDGTFYGCSGLTSVTIPNSVTSIGNDAFRSCTSLTSITIPNSVKSIGNDAFKSCSSLTSITIPNSVTSIGDNAFTYCEGLETLYFNADNCETCGNIKTTVGKEAFPPNLQNIYIGDNVKVIPQYAFAGCTGLTSLTIPSSVTSIGSKAFKGCSGLKEVNTPSIESWLNISFMDVESNPLYYSKTLFINGERARRITIPEGVERINAYALYTCESILTLDFPSSIKSIGKESFYGCTGLQRCTFPSIESYLGINYDSSTSKITYWNSKNIIYINSQQFTPEYVQWPASLNCIPAYAFYGEKWMKQIEIPETVTEIGEDAFGECSLSLLKIHDVNKWSQIIFHNYRSNPIYNLGNGIITVGDSDKPITHLDLDLGENNVSAYAFSEAKDFKTVRVKANVIEKMAFYNYFSFDKTSQLCIDANTLSEECFWGYCPKEIYCMRETPPTAFDNSFSKYEGVTLYVPIGSRSKYENSESCWWRFLDIVETDFADIDAIFKPDYELNGVENVLDNNANSGIDKLSPLEVYTINGVRVADSLDNLASGFYIVRQAGKSQKIAIK